MAPKSPPDDTATAAQSQPARSNVIRLADYRPEPEGGWDEYPPDGYYSEEELAAVFVD